MRNLFLLTLGLLTALVSFAQAPEAFTYQAVVRDASNALITNQTVSVRITVLQGTASGTAVYEELHLPVTNANGLMTLEVGQGTSTLGVFGSIDWSNGPYFLKSETDPAGGTNYSISGTSQLLSVPYALYANSADKAQTAVYSDSSNHASTATYADSAGNFAGSIWQQNGPDIYYDKGLVGIGTSTPQQALHIAYPSASLRMEDNQIGSGDTYEFINDAQDADVRNFAIYNESDDRIEMSFDGEGEVALPTGRLSIGTTSYAYPFTLFEMRGYNTDADGNIPDALFSIRNNNYTKMRLAAYSNVAFRNNSISGLRGRGTIENPLSVQPGDRVFSMMGLVHANGGFQNSPTASVEFYVGNSPFSGYINFSTLSSGASTRVERMRIDEDGKVGIGTTNPEEVLHVEGPAAAVRVEDNQSGSGDAYSLVNNAQNAGVRNFAVFNESDNRVEMSFDGDGEVALPNGRLSIGTTSYAYPFTLMEMQGYNTDADGNIPDALLSIRNNNYTKVRLAAYSNVAFRNNTISGLRGRGTISNPLNVQPGDRVFSMMGLVHANGIFQGSPMASIEFYVGNSSYSGYINFSTLTSGSTGRVERMRIDEVGNVGTGTTNPEARLQVKNGDVYLEDIGDGIIMKDANGNCWRYTPGTNGVLQGVMIVCP